MARMLRDYPHLPMLEIHQCLSIFNLCKISFNMLAKTGDKPGLMEFSRQSLYLWRKGRNPQSTAMEQVNTLAYKALACARAKTLPIGQRASMDAIKARLDGVDLSMATADALLPKAWLDAIAARDADIDIL